MFEIQTFSNASDAVVVDKAITAIGTIQGQLNDECGILRPSFTIESETVPTFNYCRIPVFGNRYYFVDGEPVDISYNLWKITLKHDPLMNWKEQFRSLDALVARQENAYNAYLTDGNTPIEADSELYMQRIGTEEQKFSTKSNVLIYSSAATKED